MSNADAPITTYDFTSGPLRGTHLTLFPHSLLHRGGAFLETIPMHALAGIRVAFTRDERLIGWGTALVVIALILFGVSGPLAALAAAAESEVVAQARGHSVASAVISVLQSLQSFAHALPVVALALVLWAAALFALGWFGATTLTLTLGTVERVYPVRGRNAMLFDFAEAASERLLSVRR